MNLVDAVLKEHSARMRTRIVRYVGANPQRFKELVRVFLEGPYRVTQRAAWPLSFCVEANPSFIKPHLSVIIRILKKPGAPDAVKRNIVRLLQFIDIPRRLHGTVASICFRFLSDPKEPIAVRVFSMSVLANIARSQPGLCNEVIMIIEDQLPYASAGFISRGRKTIKELRTYSKNTESKPSHR